MDSPLNQDWLDEITRSRLPVAEADRWRRELAERPAEARRFEEELALNELLDAAPRPRVSSNFTARVMADLGESPRQHSWFSLILGRAWESIASVGSSLLRPRFLRFLISPAAIALVALTAFLHWGWQRVQVHRHGVIARTAAEWSDAASMPGVAALQDFEAIQWLETRSAPDDVALLQLLREDVPGALP